VDSFHRDLKTFLVLLAYTVHSGLCDDVLSKSTIDIDIDIVSAGFCPDVSRSN